MFSSCKKRYLFAIYELGFDGREVHCKDIARSLGIKCPSASKMLKAIALEGLIDKEYYGTVRFTARGVRIANELYTRYLLLYAFFSETLQVSPENARRDAIFSLCDLSEESIDKISGVTLTAAAKKKSSPFSGD